MLSTVSGKLCNNVAKRQTVCRRCCRWNTRVYGIVCTKLLPKVKSITYLLPRTLPDLRLAQLCNMTQAHLPMVMHFRRLSGHPIHQVLDATHFVSGLGVAPCTYAGSAVSGLIVRKANTGNGRQQNATLSAFSNLCKVASSTRLKRRGCCISKYWLLSNNKQASQVNSNSSCWQLLCTVAIVLNQDPLINCLYASNLACHIAVRL